MMPVNVRMKAIRPDSVLAFVGPEETKVNIDWRYKGGWRWKCSACGRCVRGHWQAACPHLLAVLDVLLHPELAASTPPGRPYVCPDGPGTMDTEAPSSLSGPKTCPAPQPAVAVPRASGPRGTAAGPANLKEMAA